MDPLSERAIVEPAAPAAPSASSPVLSRARRFADVLLPTGAAAVALALHLRFLARDHALPVADASGHLVNCARWLGWLRGGDAPTEPFPPAVYLLAAALMDTFGARFDVARLAVGVHGALLVGGLAWLGQRAAGPAAGALAALLALSAPSLVGAGNLLLLDVPATAAIVWVWALAWASRGFSRPLPTLGVGLALAWGALAKYTMFLWVLPVLLVHGLRLVVRRPAAVLPLALTVGVLAPVGTALATRMTRGRADLPWDAAALAAPGTWLLGGAMALLAGWGVARKRGHDGVREGAVLGLAALLAVAIVLPWFHFAGPAVWEKVHREAVAEVKTSGARIGLQYAVVVALASWPYTWAALQVAAWGEALGQLGPRLARGRLVRWIGAAPPSWGPLPEVALTGAFGTWMTVRSLPTDPRYFLPLVAGCALVVGVGLARAPLSRWTAGLAVAALAVVQLARAGGAAVPWPALVVSPLTIDVGDFDRADHGGFFLPPAPRDDALAHAADDLVAVLGAQPLPDGCNGVALHVPGFHDGRAVGLEPQSLVAVGALAGIEGCAWAWGEGGPPPVARREARYVAIVGVRADAAEGLVATWGPALAPLHAADVEGRAFRLYRRD